MAALLLCPGRADAGDVELAPFAGLRYGGSFSSTASGRHVSMGAGFEYGATVDVPIGESWGVELLYSREVSEVSSGSASPPIDMKIERYMAGVREEKGEGKGRLLGVFLLGLTRFAPGFSGFDADERFTVGVGLGGKVFLSERFGLRAEARGYYVIVQSGAGVACVNGNCLFRYSASGLWQGDVTAAVVIRF
jgi:hypothetical protein